MILIKKLFIFPYSSALRILKPPIVTYGITLICLVVFWLQIQFQITESLMYYPETWNPLRMLTSSFAHGGWMHIFGNLVLVIFSP